MIKEEEIGKRLKEFRLQQGLTLQELAEKTHFSMSYLSKVENSKKASPVSTLIVLAKTLIASLSEIFGEVATESTMCLVKKNQRREMA